jgi:5'-3' exonuclease
LNSSKGINSLNSSKGINSLNSSKGINIEEYIDDEEIETDKDEINEKIKELKKLNTQIKNIEKNILIVKKIHSEQVIEFLESLGIPFFKAFSESEEMCAFLQKKGLVDFVVTEDTDALTFGAKKVIFGEKVYCLDTILADLQINFTSFIDLCILCGCDYTTTIPKVGPVNALRLIKKYHSIDNFEINLPEEFEYKIARILFQQNENYTVNERFEIKSMDIPRVKELFKRYSLNDFFFNKLKILLNSNNIGLFRNDTD